MDSSIGSKESLRSRPERLSLRKKTTEKTGMSVEHAPTSSRSCNLEAWRSFLVLPTLLRSRHVNNRGRDVSRYPSIRRLPSQGAGAGARADAGFAEGAASAI